MERTPSPTGDTPGVAPYDAVPSNESRRHELTGLPNRLALYDVLDKITTHPDYEGNFGVIFFDLDYLKDVNDTEGHAAGDEYLNYAAQALAETPLSDDLGLFTAHISGDEFVMIIFGINEQERLNTLTRRVQSGLDDLGISIAAGAKIHEVGETRSSMLGIADKHMYEDKIGRKLAQLSPEQKRACLQILEIATEHNLSLRDMSAICTALVRQAT